MSCGIKYPFSQSGSAVPAVSPHSPLHTSTLLAEVGRVKAGRRESLDAMQAVLSTNQNIGVL